MITNKFKYLLSRHYLKKLVAAKVITYEEFDEIDRLNKRSFLCGNKSVNMAKSQE